MSVKSLELCFVSLCLNIISGKSTGHILGGSFPLLPLLLAGMKAMALKHAMCA